MFMFAVEMIDLVPNNMFGIFSRKPEKVCVLPGLELSFERFLNEVGKLKPGEKSTSKKEPAAIGVIAFFLQFLSITWTFL